MLKKFQKNARMNVHKQNVIVLQTKFQMNAIKNVWKIVIVMQNKYNNIVMMMANAHFLVIVMEKLQKNALMNVVIR